MEVGISEELYSFVVRVMCDLPCSILCEVPV
jgi:hypothetical protein